MTYKSSVDGSVAILRRLYLIRPICIARRAFAKSVYFLFELFVLRAFKVLSSLKIVKPSGKVAAAHFDIRLVYRKNMVYATVQKRSVVRDEYISLLFLQILGYALARLQIKVIGRFVYQQEVVGF